MVDFLFCGFMSLTRMLIQGLEQHFLKYHFIIKFCHFVHTVLYRNLYFCM